MIFFCTYIRLKANNNFGFVSLNLVNKGESFHLKITMKQSRTNGSKFELPTTCGFGDIIEFIKYWNSDSIGSSVYHIMSE